MADFNNLRKVSELFTDKRAATQTFPVPRNVSQTAKKLLGWRYTKEVVGMSDWRWKRVALLAKGKPVSLLIVQQINKVSPETLRSRPVNPDKPWADPMYVAYLSCGGRAGIEWAKRITNGNT